MGIESAGSKTCDNRPLKNGKCCFELLDCMLVVKSSAFFKSDHAFKTIWRRPCLCHLIKIKGYFLKPGRPVFIMVINTTCSGVCYRIYARQNYLTMPSCLTALWHYFEFLPGVYPVINALTIGIYSYSNSM